MTNRDDDVESRSGSRHVIGRLFCIAALLGVGAACRSHDYFRIEVVDGATGRGVPMVELKTTHHVAYYTDSAGLVAFLEPGLMGEDVFFYVTSPGYDYPADAFGFRGVQIPVIPGGSTVIKVDRRNVAERLYRTTGGGIYRDSELLGAPVAVNSPVLAGKVVGQDSILGVVYRGRIFWVWGDTHSPGYPLGNFAVSAATSELPENGGLDPALGVDYTYFVDSTGFSKKMIEIPGRGFVWFDWLVTVDDPERGEILVAKYARVGNLFENHERGVAVFDERTERFEPYTRVEEWIPEYHSTHHPFRGVSKGQDYYYFTSEFAFRRVRPSLVDLADPSAYEAFTPFVAGASLDPADPPLERDSSGELVYGWKEASVPLDAMSQRRLIDAGKIEPDEGWLQLEGIATGLPFQISRGSIYWNDFRRRWVGIIGGSIGDVWYAEADTPVGPWVYARRVARHDKQFYNPTQHVFLDQGGGRVIYFEGTYTSAFTANPKETPRYDYNQIMYRLDLGDPQTYLPVPVYRVDGGREKFQLRSTVEATDNWESAREVTFFAYEPDRALPGLIPIYSRQDGGLSLEADGAGAPSFYALPADWQESERVTRVWDFDLRRHDGRGWSYRVEIEGTAGDLQASAVEGGVSAGDVTFADSAFVLELLENGRRVTLIGVLAHGSMSGTWTGANDLDVGSWIGTPQTPVYDALHSPSIVPLYAVHASIGEPPLYVATREEPAGRASVLCRVWRSPHRQLILDHATRAADRNPTRTAG